MAAGSSTSGQRLRALWRGLFLALRASDRGWRCLRGGSWLGRTVVGKRVLLAFLFLRAESWWEEGWTHYLDGSRLWLVVFCGPAAAAEGAEEGAHPGSECGRRGLRHFFRKSFVQAPMVEYLRVLEGPCLGQLGEECPNVSNACSEIACEHQ